MKLTPQDDIQLDEDLFVLVTELYEHLESGDMNYTWSILDHSISYLEEKIAPAKEAVSWWGGIEVINMNLYSALRRGGVLGQVKMHPHRKFMTYGAPYYIAKFPYDQFTPEDHVVVVENQSGLYEHPSFNSKVISTLEFDILEIGSGPKAYEPAGEFLFARKIDGPEGYVPMSHIGSPFDPYFVFSRELTEGSNGHWRLDFLRNLKPHPYA